MKKPQTKAYFNGGPRGGQYLMVDVQLRVVKVYESGVGEHVYKESWYMDDRIFQYSGVAPR